MKLSPYCYKALCLFAFVFASTATANASTPELLLAKRYDQKVEVSQYLISEKYDGVRALWNGQQLLSRKGNVFHAPDWFLKGFPPQPLDGELWIARGQFEAVVSAVRKKHPIDAEWSKVRYMVFELPDGEGGFQQRLDTLESLLTDYPTDYIQLIEQFRLDSHQALISKLESITEQGAEGLMMHLADATYQTGRSGVLLKVKIYQDAEATVIAHIAGRGKFKHMLGAILVETQQGKRFRIGSGFSHEQRNQPPPIGALVTFKYYGLTKNGIPRFASFLRMREPS